LTPSANLDLVRSIYSDWERGDYGSVEWADPEIEYVRADGPEPGTWSGLAGMAEAVRAYAGAWDEVRLLMDECRALDGERVLVLYHFVGRGKASGLDLGQVGTKAAHVFHIRDGKVVKLVIYFERERALADLGLAPEANAP
jgi:ketosteroid isomerase-like protein